MVYNDIPPSPLIKGSKIGEKAQTSLFNEKCSLSSTNQIAYGVRQKLQAMENFYLMIILDILVSSKTINASKYLSISKHYNQISTFQN